MDALENGSAELRTVGQELLDQRREETVAVLIDRRLSLPRAGAQWQAIEILVRIDLREDRFVDRDDVIEAMIKVLEGAYPCENPSDEDSNELSCHHVIDSALSSLKYIDPQKSSPRLIQVLLAKLDEGRMQAPWILGIVGEPSLIPTLESIVKKNGGTFGKWSKMAMARLGHEGYIKEYVDKLDEKGVDTDENLSDLAYIRARSSIPKIAELLYDCNAPSRLTGRRDVRYSRYCDAAVKTLSQIVEDPPIKEARHQYTDEDILIWRKWWEEHAKDY